MCYAPQLSEASISTEEGISGCSPGLALSVEWHSNDQKQGSLVGLRAPNANNPVYDMTSQDIIRQKQGTTSDKVIEVSPGDEIGAHFGYVIGGAQFANEPDNPIADANKTGFDWFMIWEDTFDTSSKQWGVDNMISNQGWGKFDMPQCIATGDCPMRVEILALHSAKSSMAAYGTFLPSQTFIFLEPTSRTTRVLLSTSMAWRDNPTNSGKPYSAPGNAPVIQC
ncbi:glycoside hydrolase family 61 protein [Biscogniauxia marginata]|nr:glycoside hydrolase family 61 protein [Biscogniauxia marginata]